MPPDLRDRIEAQLQKLKEDILARIDELAKHLDKLNADIEKRMRKAEEKLQQIETGFRLAKYVLGGAGALFAGAFALAEFLLHR